MSDEEEETQKMSIGVYEGERNADGKRHGQGTWTADNGDKYVGGYVDGERSGTGRYDFAGGAVYYEGEYLNNKKHGAGKMVYPDSSCVRGPHA